MRLKTKTRTLLSLLLAMLTAIFPVTSVNVSAMENTALTAELLEMETDAPKTVSGADETVPETAGAEPDAQMVMNVEAVEAAIAEEGTEEPEIVDGVYQIGNAAQLRWFADKVNEEAAADAVLTSDIDLEGETWTPIAQVTYVADAYAGTFDGQGHRISNLEVKGTGNAGWGLFAVVNGGIVKNVRVSGNIEAGGNIGGIVGKLQTGTIQNCSFEGTITAGGTSTKGYAGGIVGTINLAGAQITGCVNTAAVTGSYAGGIIGFTSKNTTVRGCYNTGTINGSSRSGGLAGQQSAGTISYCYNIGQSQSGICGFSNAAITNCYYANADVAFSGGSATGAEKLTDALLQSLLDNLNNGTESYFKADSAGINNGYPVLAWQQGNAATAVPIESVEITGNAAAGNKLTAQAYGANDANDQKVKATNVTYQWFISLDNKNTYTRIEEAESASYEIPDEADYVGAYLKVTASGAKNSAAYAEAGPIAKSEAMLEKEDEEKVGAALDKLELSVSAVKETTALSLPTELDGCAISWESSRPELISIADGKGEVTLPESGIITVTLTAKMSYGAAAQDKIFKIDVWADEVDADTYLQKVQDSMRWDFSTLQPVYGEDTNIIDKFQQILSDRGFDGVKVTLDTVGDVTLLAPNGTIYYPALPNEDSFAQGKQVKVVFRLTVGGKYVNYPEGNSNALLIPWATDVVKDTLERYTDEVLAEEVLRQDNSGLDEVSSDLYLPSCAGKGEGKYSFAWISWTSSDEEHLSISNENRESGADSLYNAYVGKIHQDAEPHTVTLTAVLNNPSTDISVTKSFEVLILPLTEEALEQSLNQMQNILNYYTADKLTDYTTKKTLDVSAVVNDIQLVIPKEVLTTDEREALDYGPYWDYWNYKFTVSSSDTDVIEVNGFRAYVYRPIGEDSASDREVTLTVRMASKDNPNLAVTKDIQVIVRHLSRAELNEALMLMDEAQTNYAKGLLKNNADAYSIVNSLTPYQEIVWNESQNSVQFIYTYAERQNTGIAVDEIPGWEKQEDWRLFHSSEKELLSNETLILEETPEENSFVKINSVLTHEVFGKYYTKFRNDSDYDAETLAKFQQLYKQPVSAYVLVLKTDDYERYAEMSPEAKADENSEGLIAYKTELDKPISVTFTLLGLNGATWIAATTETSFTKGATVFDVFQKVLGDNNISYKARGSYVSSINGLSEFHYGGSSGWMYTVGGVYVNSCMNAQVLSGGENIVVCYVKDYTLANQSQGSTGNEKDNDTDNADHHKKPGGSQNSSTGDDKKPGSSQNDSIEDGKKPGDSYYSDKIANSSINSQNEIRGNNGSHSSNYITPDNFYEKQNDSQNRSEDIAVPEFHDNQEDRTEELVLEQPDVEYAANEITDGGTDDKTAGAYVTGAVATEDVQRNQAPFIFAGIAGVLLIALLWTILHMKKRK
jgi:hypothetical protein